MTKPMGTGLMDLALRRRAFSRALLAGGAWTLGACKKKRTSSLSLQLNWLPEPEFGGFYEAKRLGRLTGIDLLPGSPGVPTAQLVASGKVDFGVVCADEVLRLAAQSAPIVAIFASFQRSPRALVVHASSPFTDLESLWRSDATVGMEPGQGYVRWLDHKYGGDKLTRVPRPGSLSTFIEDSSFAQGIYIFAEGAQLAERQIPTRIFEVAASGYNPYEVVVATQPERLTKHPEQVRQVIADLAKGWSSYLDDPAPTNAQMAKLNPSMSETTMGHAAKLLTSLVRIPSVELGSMRQERWDTLIEQMRVTKALERSPRAADCFVAPDFRVPAN